MPNRINLSYLVEPELNNPAGMREVQRWDRLHITRKHPALLVGANEHKRLSLRMVQPGWFVFFDGAMRSNQGSMSERIAPPNDLHHKWMIIAEYRCIDAARAQEAFAALRYELMQQVKSAEKRGGGGEPDAEAIDQLKQLADAVKHFYKRFKQAQRMVRKYTPKPTKEQQDFEQENLEYAANARDAIEDIKVPGDQGWDEEPEEEFGKRHPNEGMFPGADLTDPNYRPDILSPAGFMKPQPPITFTEQG